jgi:SSS family solute:Na+ symporter
VANPMLFALAWQDYCVVALYVAILAGMGWYFARKQKSADEYFLASRKVPWFAVGLSIIATLMSSLTYLSEPGEVWQSGITTLLGKVLAILTEMVFVLFFFIPFLMRFRFTSAYEYLGVRFGPKTRWLGVILFVCLVVFWMGFVVLAMARAVSQVAGVRLEAVITIVGVIGTIYTVAGGIRAVIWKEVLQVILMLGGCIVCMAYVSWSTGGTWLPDWLQATLDYRRSIDGESVTLVSFDPNKRISVFTFGLTMFVWHFCTHLSNQMVVQRYFSCEDLKAARRSFVTAAFAGIVINSLLVFVGLALIYYYRSGQGVLPLDPKIKRDADLIFPTFMVQQLPAGLAGAVLTAVLSAAMSTIDSGINAIGTVLTVERRRLASRERMRPVLPESPQAAVRFARIVTLVAGLCITLAAFGLDRITAGRNILEMMPRSFNCFLMPLGTMFILGIFVPRCGARAAVVAACLAFVTAISIAYAKELFGLKEVSFTWILPGAIAVGLSTGILGSLFDRPRREQVAGLTWFTRKETPKIDRHLVANALLESNDSNGKQVR